MPQSVPPTLEAGARITKRAAQAPPGHRRPTPMSAPVVGQRYVTPGDLGGTTSRRVRLPFKPRRTRSGPPAWALLLSGLPLAVSIALLLVVSLRIARYPTGAAPDFRIFLAAGHALLAGRDPYVPTTLGRLLNPHPAGGGPPPGIRFPYLPWVAYVMAGIATLPTGVAVTLWELGSVAIVAATGWLLARKLDVPHAGWAAAALATSGIATADYALGETDAILLALTCLTVVAVLQGQPLAAASAATAAALLKPQVAIMLPVCVILAFTVHPRETTRAITGVVGTAALLAGLPALARPNLTSSWLHLAISFSSSVSRTQVGLGGIDGLFRFLPTPAEQLAASGPFVALVAGFGIVLCIGSGVLIRKSKWFAEDGHQIARAWVVALPTSIWLMATPYSHLNDLIVAYPLGLLIVGPRPATASRPAVWAAILTILLGPAVFALATGSVFHFKSLAGVWLLPLIGVGTWQVWARVSPSEPTDLSPLELEQT